MNSFQRVVKYCAIAFAIILAVGIISGIVNVVLAIVSVGTGGFGYHDNENTIDFDKSFSEVRSLDIDNATGELKIMVGETFRVEAENVSESFEARVTDNGKLVISENNDDISFFFFHLGGFDSLDSKVTLYLPADFIAEEAKIDTGAGSVTVEGLHTDYLFVSAGAGNITGTNVAAEGVKIDGGVGNINFSGANFKDADLDRGVGNLSIEGTLLGKNKVDCGVGEVRLDLNGDVEDYDLDVDSGIGTIRLNGEKISQSQSDNSDAPNYIKIDGGVGNVKINRAQ